MNITVLSGRITKDVELRKTRDGGNMVSFCLAVDKPYTKDKTDFIDCCCFGSNAEFMSKYVHKGDPVEVVGVLAVREWQASDGTKRKSYCVECSGVAFTKQNKKERSEGKPEEEKTKTEDFTLDGAKYDELFGEEVPF